MGSEVKRHSVLGLGANPNEGPGHPLFRKLEHQTVVIAADYDALAAANARLRARLARAVGLLRDLERHMEDLPTWRSACADGTEGDWCELPRDWVGRDDELWEQVDAFHAECAPAPATEPQSAPADCGEVGDDA